MSPEPLSSRAVYVSVKYVSPAIYLVLASLVLVGLLLPGSVIAGGFPPIARVLLVVAAPLAAMAYTAFLWDLKYVELDGDRLVVSGVHRRTTIPLSEIAGVRQDLMEPGRPIYVDLKHPCTFGRSFSFVAMPPFGLTRFDEYPVVGRLRILAGVGARDARDTPA